MEATRSDFAHMSFVRVMLDESIRRTGGTRRGKVRQRMVPTHALGS
jgi:hypothetical protein